MKAFLVTTDIVLALGAIIFPIVIGNLQSGTFILLKTHRGGKDEPYSTQLQVLVKQVHG